MELDLCSGVSTCTDLVGDRLPLSHSDSLPCVTLHVIITYTKKYYPEQFLWVMWIVNKN